MHHAPKQKMLAHKFNYSSHYEWSFFQPYQSINDAKCNAKAIFFRPIINCYLSLTALQESLLNATLGLANITIGCLTFDSKDIKGGCSSISASVNRLFSAVYFALFSIIDSLDALLRLATHSIATVTYGLETVGEAIMYGLSHPTA